MVSITCIIVGLVVDGFFVCALNGDISANWYVTRMLAYQLWERCEKRIRDQKRPSLRVPNGELK